MRKLSLRQGSRKAGPAYGLAEFFKVQGALEYKI